MIAQAELMKESRMSKDGNQWPTFEVMLRQLHQAGIYLHPDQLAKFLIRHGLPVDLQYVPAHLQHQATQINDNYLGDMARLEVVEPPWYAHRFYEAGAIARTYYD